MADMRGSFCAWALRTAVLAGLALAAGQSWEAGAAGASRDGAWTELGDLEITADTTWAEGQYRAQSLRVTNAATLSVAGGSVVEVVGALTVDGGATLLLQGKNTAGQVEGAWAGVGVSLSAASATLEAGSAISADGQGYGPDAIGPGYGGTSGGNHGGGGSHGGWGGQMGDAGGAPYGSIPEPADLGSGGGYGEGPGYRGGGAVRLSVSGDLRVDGRISAVGEGLTSGGRRGAGAGGSVWITVTGSLSGTGTISAEGGPSGWRAGAGGGGRVAVHVGGSREAFTGTLSAAGGQGGTESPSGGPGTIHLVSAGQPGDLVLDNLGRPCDRRTPLALAQTVRNVAILDGVAAEVTASGEALVQTGAGELRIGNGSSLFPHSPIGFDTVRVLSGGVLGHLTGDPGLTVTTAAGFIVDAGGRVTADGAGFGPAAGPGYGSSGAGDHGNGGSYGGWGGLMPGGTPGGAPYGSIREPVDLGSGGGLSSAGGRAGGGAIRLIVGGDLEVAGSVSANGQASTDVGGRAGAGSGGSIWLTVTGALTGAGTISADGGNSAWRAGAGGGGRVAVYLGGSREAFAGTLSAAGGQGGSESPSGGAGTVLVSAAGQAGDLVLANGGRDGSLPTPLALVRPVGDLRLLQGAEAELSASEAAVPLAGSGELQVGPAGFLTVRGAVGFGSARVLAGGTLTHVAGDAGLALHTVHDLAIDAGGVITGDALGFGPGAGPGYGETSGGNHGAGGSYGGLGGWYLPPPAGIGGGGTYGEPEWPIHLGSGGGYGAGWAGAGGGSVRLVVGGHLVLDGRVSAAGQSSSMTNRSGAGSGGSVWVTVSGLFSGTGEISADGGDSGWRAGAGGGGRVLLEAGRMTGTWTAHANGGNAGSESPGGGGGSVLVRTSEGNDVPAAGFAAAAGLTHVDPPPAEGTVRVDSVAPLRWSVPPLGLVHGEDWLSWTLLGEGYLEAETEVLLSRDGVDTAIATGVSAFDRGFHWDSTEVADGLYEFRAIATTPDGQTVETVRQMLVNNSVLWHSGALTGDETWAAGRVHVVDGPLTVPSGTTLTVAPGAVVKFAQGIGLVIESGAAVDVQSTADAITVLTALPDDTVGGDTNLDWARSLPVAGYWSGIRNLGGTLTLAETAQVRYTPPIVVGYALAASQTWYPWSVYRVQNALSVPAGVTLTIQPGTVVKFAADQGLEVQAGGTLWAEGTAAQPVWFTSDKDDSVGGDSNGDGDATVPYAGDWYEIQNHGGTILLDDARVAYGGGRDNGFMIGGDAGSTIVTNSVLSHALFRFVSPGGSATVLLSSCLLVDGDWAIETFGGTTTVLNCTIDDVRSGILGHGGDLQVANTIVSNYTEFGLYGFSPHPAPTARHCDLWSPQGSQTNWGDLAGSEGNLSADPQYRDPERGDYRLGFVSPCIDAADATVAPPGDATGAPRYDDPRTANTGVADPEGRFADLGPFEFVETADSAVDLTVAAVSGPLAVLAGEMATVTWRVVNTGSGPAVGPWHDTVWLVPASTGREGLISLEGEAVLVGQGVVLGPGQEREFSATVRIPGGVIGTYRYQVEVNSRGDVFEGAHRANNTGLAEAPVDLDLPELALGGAGVDRQFAASGESLWFKVVPGAGMDAMVTVTRPDTGGVIELYAARGTVPTDDSYEVKELPMDVGAAALRALVPAVAEVGVPCYVTVFCRSTGGQARPVTVSARELDFEVVAWTPRSLAPGGLVPIEFHGGGLGEDAQYRMVSGDGGVSLGPASVERSSSVQAKVVFDLPTFPAGPAELRIEVPGARGQRGGGGVTVPVVVGLPSGGTMTADIAVHVDGPSSVRVGDTVIYTMVLVHGLSGGFRVPSIRASVGWTGRRPGIVGLTGGSLVVDDFDPGQVYQDTFAVQGIAEGMTSLRPTMVASGTPRDGDEIPIDVVASADPNDKYGVLGPLPARFVPPQVDLRYTVLFENKPDATAPAQTVVITDRVDLAVLDSATFGFRDVRFGATRLQPPRPGLTAWSETVDLRPANALLVQMDAVLDPATGEITWCFRSLDPLTRAPTRDPLAGFLPPNVTSPQGEGSVKYSIRPKAGLPTGTRCEEHATIVFDVNDPIDTPAWLNTLDAVAPTSTVAVLPRVSPYPQFTVNWSGTDDAGGSGITGYDVHVAVDGGAWSLWQADTAETQAVYDGQRGHSYQFYAVACDGVGNTEAQPVPIAAEAQAWVPLLDDDTDADGLPDWFEAVIINANAGDPVDGFEDVAPLADFDGDTAPNLQESRAETDPTDPGDVPGVAAPNGPLLAAVTDPARGWWDLTGPYATTVSGVPLTLAPVMDTKGKIAGLAHLTLTKDMVLELPIKGSAKGSAGALVVKLALKGATADKLSGAALTLNLTLNAAARQLTGPVTGLITVDGIRVPVDEVMNLAIPPPMDGTWTLLTALVQGAKGLTGTATLRLSNGAEYDFLIKGKVAGETAMLSLSGDPADPPAKGIKIKTTITPMEAGAATLNAFSAKGYGQSLSW